LQTAETTRRLGEVDRELIRKVLDSVFAHRAAGDFEAMLAFLDSEVVCFADRTWGYAHYPRRIVGKEALREALRQRHINYVWINSVVHRTLIDGDSAAVHRTTTLSERGSGETFTFDSIGFYRFREGLITEINELPDGGAREVVNNFPF
jgi:ketosteroid isomerase-like protein